ncbi:MAG TPA: metal-dependent hydrolase [Thermoplasmata archaeon]|nr:metal-dependent hydrolase [Thermoplasmata archaeon]
MDLFTHVLIGYLLSVGLVGFQPQYLAAGALAGGLPDADIFFFPLARRFPMLRHHGITHSIFGVTVIAVVGGGLLAPHLAPGNPWLYVLVMEAAGLGHMLQDGFTHFSVPPLLPFSERRLELDADRAINFVTLVVSVSAFYLLLGVERNQVPFPVYVTTVYALMAFYGAYFALRLGARLWIGRRLPRLGPFEVPIPTTSPLTWLLLSERKDGGRVRTVFAEYTLGRGIVRGPFSVDVPADSPPGPPRPAATEGEALAVSYPLARGASRVLDETYHFGEAVARLEGGWTVHWYSLEFTAFGRAAGVRVDLAATGETHVRRSWATPGWRRRAAA